MADSKCPVCGDGPMTDDRFIEHCDDEFERIVRLDDLENKAIYTVALVRELRQRVPAGTWPNSKRRKVGKLFGGWKELIDWSIFYVEVKGRLSRPSGFE